MSKGRWMVIICATWLATVSITIATWGDATAIGYAGLFIALPYVLGSSIAFVYSDMLREERKKKGLRGRWTQGDMDELEERVRKLEEKRS